MTQFGVEGVLERLKLLDEDLFALHGQDRRFEIVLVGGSAFMLQGLAPDTRHTSDIDVLQLDHQIERFLLQYDMNTDANTFLYSFPNGWGDRKCRVPFEGMVLDVYTPSDADLAISKILSWRETDQNDLRGMVAGGRFDARAVAAILEDVTELQAQLDKEDWALVRERYDMVRGWFS